MDPMNKAEIEARSALGKFGVIVDPQYARDPEKAETELKDRVRACWSHRDHFPSWIKAYIAKWTAAGKGVESPPV